MSDSSINEPYWVTVGGKQMGPYRLSQLQDMWQVGAITEDAYYFQEGYDHWEPISQIADLLDGPQVPESADDSSFQAPAPTWSEPTGQAAGVELGPVVSEEDTPKSRLPWYLAGGGLVIVVALLLFLQPWAGETDKPERHRPQERADAKEETKTGPAQPENRKTGPAETENPNEGTGQQTASSEPDDSNASAGLATLEIPEIAYLTISGRPERRLLVFVAPGESTVKIENQDIKEILMQKGYRTLSLFSETENVFSYPEKLEDDVEARKHVRGSVREGFTMHEDFANGDRGVLLGFSSVAGAEPTLLVAFIPTEAVSLPLQLSRATDLRKGANLSLQGQGLELHSADYESQLHKLDASNAGPLDVLVTKFYNSMERADEIAYQDFLDRQLKQLDNSGNPNFEEVKAKYFEILPLLEKEKFPASGISVASLRAASNSTLSAIGSSIAPVDMTLRKDLLVPLFGTESDYKQLLLHFFIDKHKNEVLPNLNVFGKRDGIALPQPNLTGLIRSMGDFETMCNDLSEAKEKNYANEPDKIEVAEKISAFDQYLALDKWVRAARYRGVVWGNQPALIRYLADAINAEAKTKGLVFNVQEAPRTQRLTSFYRMVQRAGSFRPDPLQREKLKIATAKKYTYKSSSSASAVDRAVRTWEAKVELGIPALQEEFDTLLADLAALDKQVLAEDRSYSYFHFNYTYPVQANLSFQTAPSEYYELLLKQAEARDTIQAEYKVFLRDLAALNEEAEDMHGALQAINDWELRMDGRTVVKFK